MKKPPDIILNLYTGTASPKEQRMAAGMLIESSPLMADLPAEIRAGLAKLVKEAMEALELYTKQNAN